MEDFVFSLHFSIFSAANFIRFSFFRETAPVGKSQQASSFYEAKQLCADRSQNKQQKKSSAVNFVPSRDGGFSDA